MAGNVVGRFTLDIPEGSPGPRGGGTVHVVSSLQPVQQPTAGRESTMRRTVARERSLATASGRTRTYRVRVTREQGA